MTDSWRCKGSSSNLTSSEPIQPRGKPSIGELPTSSRAITLLSGNIGRKARVCLGTNSIEPICDESGEMNSGQEIPTSLSYRVAMRRKSLSLQKLRSMTFRPL